MSGCFHYKKLQRRTPTRAGRGPCRVVVGAVYFAQHLPGGSARGYALPGSTLWAGGPNWSLCSCRTCQPDGALRTRSTRWASQANGTLRAGGSGSTRGPGGTRVAGIAFNALRTLSTRWASQANGTLWTRQADGALWTRSPGGACNTRSPGVARVAFVTLEALCAGGTCIAFDTLRTHCTRWTGQANRALWTGGTRRAGSPSGPGIALIALDTLRTHCPRQANRALWTRCACWPGGTGITGIAFVPFGSCSPRRTLRADGSGCPGGTSRPGNARIAFNALGSLRTGRTGISLIAFKTLGSLWAGRSRRTQRGPGGAVIEIEPGGAVGLVHHQARGRATNQAPLLGRHSGNQHTLRRALHVEQSRSIGRGAVGADAERAGLGLGGSEGQQQSRARE